jgi:hypothetical protein
MRFSMQLMSMQVNPISFTLNSFGTYDWLTCLPQAPLGGLPPQVETPCTAAAPHLTPPCTAAPPHSTTASSLPLSSLPNRSSSRVVSREAAPDDDPNRRKRQLIFLFPAATAVGVSGGSRARLPKAGAVVARPWTPLRAEAGSSRGGDSGRRVWWGWPSAKRTTWIMAGDAVVWRKSAGWKGGNGIGREVAGRLRLVGVRSRYPDGCRPPPSRLEEEDRPWFALMRMMMRVGD